MKKSNEKTQFFGGYVPKSLAEWAVKQAQTESRSVTGYIINLLKEKRNGKTK